ncbi:SIR2 family protein [Furfurilactobacillus rossiae]|mgnify:CR=1 FL=1|uniref:SIR2 family NAD-dependent protein deacylase n=1 Tax=Furfurilactobacillus rossiae TaxID=231049 RepID=UPI001F2DE461|nr:SIR2 family protein [Furfurilactobacillus rossiae]MCF6165336.1 SIR2 family protein [Furfurilactobacillus rossiae]
MCLEETNDCLDNLVEEISKWGVGIIAGAGLSMAVIGDSKEKTAKNWKQLFISVEKYFNNKYSDDFGVDVVSELEQGSTLPQIATKMCNKVSVLSGKPYDDSKNEIKQVIRSLVNWVPTTEQAKKYESLLKGINVKWVITTNYDEVLEAIFNEYGYPINPQEPFVAPKDMIPIYHIHGSRNSYQSMIVTHEDYVQLFRPGNYRENKLVTIMAETPVMILGYSLSDLNLLAGLDQSNNAFDSQSFSKALVTYNSKITKDYDVLQEKEFGCDKIETNSIEQFLTDLGVLVSKKIEAKAKLHEEEKQLYRDFDALIEEVEELNVQKNVTYYEYVQNNAKSLISDLNNAKSKDILRNPAESIKKLESTADDNKGSIRPIEFMAFNKSVMILMQFLRGSASLKSHFEDYNTLLKFIFTLIGNFDESWFTPLVMKTITRNLNFVLDYSKPAFGNSWSANKTCQNEAPGFKREHPDFWHEIYLQASIGIATGEGDMLVPLKEKFDEIDGDSVKD